MIKKNNSGESTFQIKKQKKMKKGLNSRSFCFSILWGNCSGHQEDLAKFGYGSEIKVNLFKNLL